MEFSPNSWILYLIAGIIILFVLAQSVFFLVRAVKRAKELGIEGEKVKKVISSSAVFTIAPAVSILIGIIVLSVSLGVPLPWLRLSVVGSLSYETTSAGLVLEALGLKGSELVSDASSFVTVAIVMTVGIMAGLLFVPMFTKKIQSGFIKIGMKDKKWGEILNNAMFLGMISAFLGFVFCDVTNLFQNDAFLENLNVTRTACLIPVLVMFSSAITMVICGLLSKKFKIRWLNDYALPFSLICGMVMAIPITAWLG